MGDMFRSERMALCQMFIQHEAAYASIAELGERGCVQFRDVSIVLFFKYPEPLLIKNVFFFLLA